MFNTLRYLLINLEFDLGLEKSMVLMGFILNMNISFRNKSRLMLTVKHTDKFIYNDVVL